MIFIRLFVAIFIFFGINSVYAQDNIALEIETLKQQLQTISQKLTQLEALQKQKEAPLKTTASVQKLPTENKLITLQNTEEKNKPSPPKNDIETLHFTSELEAGKKGFVVKAREKDYEFSVRGLMQLDGNYLAGNKFSNTKDEMLLRRLRPTFAGNFNDFSFKFTPDFAGEITRVMDAHIDYKFDEVFSVRAGKFKPPVGFERLMSSSDILFLERGLPTNLVNNRDVGIMAYGNLYEGKAKYELGIFNGSADGENGFSDADSYKDVAGRVLVKPWKNEQTILQGTGVGVAGSVGKHKGTNKDTILSNYDTVGGQEFFSYKKDSVSDGMHFHISPQAYFTHENMGILSEYVVSSEKVRNSIFKDRLNHKAWQIATSYIFTGENVDFENSLEPYKNFSLENGTGGAWELVTRVGGMSLDKKSFLNYADNDSSSKIISYGLGLNWYLNPSVKLMGDYNYTNLEKSPSGKELVDEHSLSTRAQFVF